MFINCPQCRALVATDLATGQPPERCPRCSARLREAPESATAAKATQPDADAPLPTAQPKATAEAPAPKPDATKNATHDAALVVTLPGTAPAAPPDAPAPKSLLRNFSNFLKTPSPEVEAATATAIAETKADEVTDSAATTADQETADIPAASAPAQPSQSLQDDDKSEPVAASAPPSQPKRDKEAKPQAKSAPIKSAPTKSAPSFARSVDAPGTMQGTRGWKLPAAIAALALLLALQLLLADRNRLAADAGWRPVVAAVCGVLRCSLPPWHEPAAFVLIDRDVQAHPKKSGVLRVTATFRNDARWAQPWPRLQLILSDIDGNPVAARVFTVHEYLGAAPQQPLLASGQTASIAMDIAEPAARSVAFDFALQ